MTSLRGRLLWGIIGGMIILLLVFSILLYNIIHKALNHRFDASLLSTARMLAAAIEEEGDFESTGQTGKIEFEIDTGRIPEFSDNSAAGFYQLHRQDGQLIARSPSLKDQTLIASEISEKPRYRKILLPGGKPGRSVCIWFVPAEEKTETQFDFAKEQGRLLALVIARDASDLYEQFMFLRLLFTGASAALIGLSVIIGSLVVKTSLKSLNSLAKDIARINVETLGNPLNLAKLPSEMVPVVQKLNDLLDRLKLSFERQRCFTADVAHELRTPLAGIRSTLEVALSRPRELPAYRESMADCLDITAKMQGLVEKLLVLARLDADQMTLTSETFSVTELIDHCWKPFAQAAEKRSIVFKKPIPPELLCRTDKTYLAMALSNLLENAAAYTNTGGTIWTESRIHEGRLEIRIANTGSTLTEDQVNHIFDRFWRADPARTDTGLHCGLGLTLVEKLIHSLNAKIQITSTDGTFSAILVLNNDTNADKI